MTFAGVVDQILDEYYPWAKPHGQNSWDKDSLGQPAPGDTLGQPAPGDTLGQPAPDGTLGQPAPEGTLVPPTDGNLGQPAPTGQLGQPLPPLEAPLPPAPKAETSNSEKPQGSFNTFGVPVSNVRALPDDLNKITIVLDATVTPHDTPQYTAINFMTSLSDEPGTYLESYIIHVRFQGYDEPIHFTQKILKKWTDNASVTNFTLKDATYNYDSHGTRKIRIVVSHVLEEGGDTYIFSFLSEDGQWLNHKFQPGYKIDHIYRYGPKHAGDAALDNDLTVTPIPLFRV
ncbi:hypothetical protein TWF481_005210 [Arthrobotrys musiformis]|uniref:Uncharacterized protein n=1 Tax=Arthrobotrys musiformis TaxID=47236 RepID=A0AAV9WDT2_9PEZI